MLSTSYTATEQYQNQEAKKKPQKPRSWHWYNPQNSFRFQQLHIHLFVCVHLLFFFFFFLIYFWLRWVFVAVPGLSLVAASKGYSSLRCAGFSLWWLLLLRSTGSTHMGFSSCGSRALERRFSSCGNGLSCSAACGIFPDQGPNLCPLHWQVDSYPLHHQGSPCVSLSHV